MKKPYAIRHTPFANHGFTLIELLVVVAIVAIVGSLVINLFASNLRASIKSKALTAVKQNGDYALAVMERMIRNADSISPCSIIGETSEALTIVNPDGGTTIFACYPDPGTTDCLNTQIASNSACLTSKHLEVKTGSCSFFCQKPRGKPAVVTVRFTISQKSTYLGREFMAAVPFEITVSTRTY